MSVSVCVCVCVRHIIMIDSNCFDKVPNVGSWWNFQRCFWRMIPIIWYHFQVHQELPCPPTLQEETWRTGGILTRFLMLDLDETFTEASEVWSLSYDTTSRFIRNLNILQDSRKRLGGQVESWQGFWCLIFMKLSGKLLLYVHFHLRPSPGALGTSTSSKTPRRDSEDRWTSGSLSRPRLSSKSLLGVLEDVEVPDTHGDGLREASMKVLWRLDVRKQVKTSPVLQVSSWSLWGHGCSWRT